MGLYDLLDSFGARLESFDRFTDVRVAKLDSIGQSLATAVMSLHGDRPDLADAVGKTSRDTGEVNP